MCKTRSIDVRIPARLKISASALVRFPDVRRSLSDGKIRGVLSVYTRDVATSVTMGGREVPVEYEPTAALAFSLEGSPVWDFEMAGFLSGSFQVRRATARTAIVPGPRPERQEDGLFLTSPSDAS